MVKKITKSSAPLGETQAEGLSIVAQDDAVSTASGPAGGNGPAGDDTPESSGAEGGDGNVAVPAGDTAPSAEMTDTTASDGGDAAGQASAEPVKPQAGDEPTPGARSDADNVSANPDAEASASGANATHEEDPNELRVFDVVSPIRFDNVRYPVGSLIQLTKAGHRQAAKCVAGDWDDGLRNIWKD